MGNQNSTNKEQSDELKPKSISQILDYIATYYILTMDFKSLRKLYDKEYCDNLIILTSDIIERYFTDLEITYLAQRIKDGVEVNELEKDKVKFFFKDDLNKLDVQNSIKKKRMCNSIAKFYIKIAHTFAAIVSTINPIYVYKDAEGNEVKANLYNKGKIPAHTPRDIYKLNICETRVNTLSNKEDYSELSGDNEMRVHPKICDMNLNQDGSVKNLDEEPGIPELEDLYYDDQYDYYSGEFKSMSPKTRDIYDADLKIFYKIFTGNDEVPEIIKSFRDIKLRDYKNNKNCTGTDPVFRKVYKDKASDNLFASYAKNLRDMIIKANLNQQALLNILNQLFLYTIDPQTNKKQIRVSPFLTEDALQALIIETRALIIKLYLTCEIDYTNGIKIFEAIVEKKILETAQSQIDNLEKISDKTVTDEIAIPAEMQELKNIAQKKIEAEKMEISKKENELTSQEKEVAKNPISVIRSINEPNIPKPIPKENLEKPVENTTEQGTKQVLVAQ